MKTLVTRYSFNAAAKTVTFNGYVTIQLERVLVITNLSTNTIIYNFAGVGQGGSVSGSVLTLNFDTTAMSNSDKLQVWYDDSSATDSVLLGAINASGSREILGLVLAELRGIRLAVSALAAQGGLADMKDFDPNVNDFASREIAATRETPC